MQHVVPWYILVLISAAILAIAEIMRKHVLNHEHSLEQLAAEAPFRVLVILFLVPALEPLTITEYILIVGAATALLTLLYLRNKSMRHLPISTIAPLMNLSPVLLLIVAAVILGERPTPVQMGGILLVVIGGYALEARGGSLLKPLANATRSSNFLTVAAFLVMLTVMATIDKLMLGTVTLPVFTYLFWLYLFSSIGSFALHGYRYRWEGIRNDIKRGWFWLLLIAAAAVTNISIFYTALAMPGVLVSLAVPIRRVATLLETVFGGHLFHEDGVWRKAVGCAVMLLGVLLIV